MDVVIDASLWDEGEDGECVIATWLFNDKDPVNEGDLIAEVMLEKAAFDLLAPATGQLSILIAEEVEIPKGGVVAKIIS